MKQLVLKYNILKLALLFVLLPSVMGVGRAYISLYVDGDVQTSELTTFILNNDSSSTFLLVDDDESDDKFHFVLVCSIVDYDFDQVFKYHIEEAYLEWSHYNLFCFSDSSPPSC